MTDMKLLHWTYSNIDVPRFLDMARARKAAFIDRFGWDIPTYSGGEYEIDQFDTPAAHYITFETNGRIYGSARLLPHPFSMTREIWPQLYDQIDTDYQEVSRLTLHGETNRAMTKAASDLMRRFMANGDYYGCADKYMLRVYPVMFGLTPVDVYPDPDGDPEINIAILSNGG